jgi:hypothetical protein
MAGCDLDIVVESDLVEDAMREVLGILDRVRFRHGPRFRRLEQLIDTAPGADWRAGTRMWEIGPGHYVLGVPRRLAAIIAEARRLQV